MARRAPSIDRAVARSLRRHREVLAAYLFESVATGRAHPGSDVDVAVLLDSRLTARRAFAARLNLIAELGGALGGDDVDLVVLNEASPLLANRVLATGRLLFERSAPEDRGRGHAREGDLGLEVDAEIDAAVVMAQRKPRGGREAAGVVTDRLPTSRT